MRPMNSLADDGSAGGLAERVEFFRFDGGRRLDKKKRGELEASVAVREASVGVRPTSVGVRGTRSECAW